MNTHIGLRYLPLLLAALFFVVLRHYYFAQTGDDSYIYFRYVERALAGNWWSWTNHIPPVEGYSSPLWYLLLTVTGKLGVSVIDAARGWGLVFAFLTVVGAWRTSRLLGLGTQAAGLVCLALVLNHGFQYWASAGLETALYMALFVWSLNGIISERYWILPTALIGVARPEGPFLLIGIVVALFIFKRHCLSTRNLALLLAPAVLWQGLRLAVYGELLPNTFYAKATGTPSFQLLLGGVYSLPVFLPLLAIWVLWLRGKLNNHREAVMIAAGMVTMLLAIIWIGGGDWMFHFRLLLPLLAPLLALWVNAFLQTEKIGKSVLLVSMLPLLLLVVPPWHLWSAFKGETLPVIYYQEGELAQHTIELADQINDQYPDGVLMAVNHAGVLPWALPEFDVIDMVGLNDAHIAREEGDLHKKHDPGYVLSQKPELIVLNSKVEPGTEGTWYHPGYWVGETALVEHPRFSDYEPTEFTYRWQGQVAFPYSLFVDQKRVTIWTLVYKLRSETPSLRAEL